jgi:hypothetical protein
MEAHWLLAAISPEYRARRRQIEAEVRDFIAAAGEEGLRTGVVRIPVVVHVVWNTAAQNIPDSRIHDQIAVLNADFRRINADAGSVPMAFGGVAADTRIEFALAVRDPNCNATSGITRTNTTVTGFPKANKQNVKSAATGGADPWPRDRYLNIWVANLTGGLLGFASFPGEPANLDGVVIRTSAFGTNGATAPFNLGRTATHEVGHWLNLLHIWGDDQLEPDTCSFSDECADTPNQAVARTGSPPFPSASCGNGPNGDMFMNYMDYVDDVAMFMFTRDQASRMHASLSVARAAILASDGLVPPVAPAVSDLWMQDHADDNGTEPSPISQPMWVSDDIWVRHAADGLTNQDHQNPRAEAANNVYVRVRHRGCTGAPTLGGTLRLYWAKASTGLSWPAPWDGSLTSPALMGGVIGAQAVSVAGGSQQILVFPWTPPDPSDYAAFGADRAHFCLLARLETAAAAPFGMTAPETGDLFANVRNNNNIVWKNISVVDVDGEGGRFADVVIGGLSGDGRRVRLVFDVPKTDRRGLFDWGHVLVAFRGDALAGWAKGEVKGSGFQRLADGRLVITDRGAMIEGPTVKKGAAGTLHLRFVPDAEAPTGARVFALDVTERDAEGRPIGGQRFLLKTGSPPRRSCEHATARFDGVTWVCAADCGCGGRRR